MKFNKTYSILFVIAFALSMFIKPALCFLLLGSLAFYMGIASIIYLKKIKEKGITSTGRILSYESDSDGYKTPIIEFTLPSGELVTEKPVIYGSTDLSKIRSYKKKINQEITIVCDPDDPKKFVLSEERGFNQIASVILILIGLGFIILSICWLLGYINMG